MAKQILLRLGATDVATADTASAMVAAHPNGERILKLVQEKQRLLKDAWLTDTGHIRPGMKKGLPLAEAQAQAAEMDELIKNSKSQSPKSK